MRYEILFAAITFAVTFSLSGCANGRGKTEQAFKCTDHGVGVSSAPSPATKAAMADHAAAEKLPLQTLIENANKGEVAAQVELGLRYINGTGVDKNPKSAVELFRAAAEKNNPLGQFFLGTAYSQGVELQQSDVVAIELWEKAARNGYPNAQFWLGMMIANGYGGIAADWCAAISLFVAASDQVTDAAFMAGFGFHEGKFSEPSYEEAAKYYRLADTLSRKQTGIYNQKARYNLRLMIEEGRVKWQAGDPGSAPESNLDGDDKKEMQLHIQDPAVEKTG